MYVSQFQNTTSRVLVNILLLVTSMTAACDSKFGGKTAQEEFSNPSVAAMVEAAVDGEIKEMNDLIDAGADVNAISEQGVSPLMWVLAARSKKGVEGLLKKGANPNYRAPNGYSAMYLAVGGNTKKMLELVLQYGGDPNHLGGPRKEPIIFIATSQRRWEHLDLLFDRGADINAESWGRTVGNIAVAHGLFDKLAYFLEKGLSYDLEGLAKSAKNRPVPKDSKQYQWKLKVIEMFKSRGVKL